MRKARQIALVGAGRTATSLSRLPGLGEHLGPVMASSLRVASRIVNQLRAGRPVADAIEFADCPLVLVCVPDAQIEKEVHRLVRSGVEWRGRSVVLAETLRDSIALTPLAERGALTASVNALQSVQGSMFIGDGDARAIALFRKTLLTRSARLLRLDSGGKPLFLAGLSLARLPLHLADAAGQSMRAAGLPAGFARSIVKHAMAESVRAFAKAGKANGAVWSKEEWESLRAQIQALRESQPELATYFVAALESAMKWAGGKGNSRLLPFEN